MQGCKTSNPKIQRRLQSNRNRFPSHPMRKLNNHTTVTRMRVGAVDAARRTLQAARSLCPVRSYRSLMVRSCGALIPLLPPPADRPLPARPYLPARAASVSSPISGFGVLRGSGAEKEAKTTGIGLGGVRSALAWRGSTAPRRRAEERKRGGERGEEERERLVLVVL